MARSFRLVRASAVCAVGLLAVGCGDGGNTVEKPAKYESPPQGMKIQAGPGGGGKAAKESRGTTRPPE